MSYPTRFPLPVNRRQEIVLLDPVTASLTVLFTVPVTATTVTLISERILTILSGIVGWPSLTCLVDLLFEIIGSMFAASGREQKRFI